MASPDSSASRSITTSSSISSRPTMLNPINNRIDQLITINVSAQCPIKLTQLNYSSWRLQFNTLLVGYDLLGFVDGSLPCPSPTVSSDNGPVPNPAYSFWIRQDQLILNAIIGSLSPTLVSFISTARTSRDAWLALLTDMAENTGDTKSVVIDIREDKRLIHRVPRKLRKVNESAYNPQLISIGPFHYGEFDEMKNLKEKYYDAFLNRNKEIKVSNLQDVIKKCSEKLRSSYDVIYALTDDEFEEMILKDSCFIIELFLRNADDPDKGGKWDCILSTSWLRKAIKLDLILLENQLPFFVLQNLYEAVKKYLPPVKIPKPKSDYCNSSIMSCSCLCRNTSLTCCQVKKFSQQEVALNQKPDEEENDDGFDPLLKLARYFFEDYFLTVSDSRKKFDDIKEIKHFTDLLRWFWLPWELIKDKQPKQGNITERKYLYSATKLDKAGVTFTPAPKGTSLTDVKISKNSFLKFIPGSNCMQLKLPKLKLENDTECLLRNVMALEQCLYPEMDYVCNYVTLMDQLINTREDVEFLVDKKILTNLLGSNKEAAKLINSLCNQIPREIKAYYAHFYDDLKLFYENRWNVTRATLKKVYFKDLWTGSSTVVGLFVLLFTVSATIKNVYFRHL